MDAPARPRAARLRLAAPERARLRSGLGGAVMDKQSRAIDPEKMKALVERVFGILGGAVTAGMIHLGDRLGLYRALAGAGPLTSDALARKTELHERWVREWLHAQAVTGLGDYAPPAPTALTRASAMVPPNEASRHSDTRDPTRP